MATRRARRLFGLIAVIAALGLVSCADNISVKPIVGFGPEVPQPLPAPNPPTPTNPSGPADSLLDAHRALWATSGFDHYRYRFRWECFCTEEFVRTVDITVMNDAVVSVLDASTGRPVPDEYVVYYETIEGLFDFMQNAIDFPASSFRFVYDANLGYPSETYVDYVAGMADDERGFRIYGLSPIEQP